MSNDKPRSAAAELRPGFFARIKQGHMREVRFTLNKFWSNLGGALLTCLAIGITLALPAALHTLVRNVNAASYSWESTLEASLFLKDSVTAEAGAALAENLKGKPNVAGASYITREQSLAEFRSLSGFGAALDLLEGNPLPAVIAVTPRKGASRGEIDALIADLSRLPEVEVAKLDRQWLERLYAVLALIERLVLVLAAILSMAVIVIVGNTIRLDIEARRAEIEVMKLIGATDAFIRRPFLYTGLWYGLVGGMIAFLLVEVVVLALSSPTSQLAGLYQSDFHLKGMSLSATAAVFASGILLGWLGAWWTVARRIREIEPK